MILTSAVMTLAEQCQMANVGLAGMPPPIPTLNLQELCAAPKWPCKKNPHSCFWPPRSYIFTTRVLYSLMSVRVLLGLTSLVPLATAITLHGCTMMTEALWREGKGSGLCRLREMPKQQASCSGGNVCFLSMELGTKANGMCYLKAISGCPHT